MNTKKKAEIAVGKAIAYYTERGYTVSIPLTDSQKYDLIVEFDGKLNRIQVKYTGIFSEYGKPILTLKSTSGTTRKSYSVASKDNCDWIFCFCSDGRKWHLPIQALTGVSSSINLGEKWNSYLI